MVLLDLIIFFLIFYFLEKSVLRLRYAIVFTLIFVALKSMTAFENNRRKEAVVYSTKKLLRATNLSLLLFTGFHESKKTLRRHACLLQTQQERKNRI